MRQRELQAEDGTRWTLVEAASTAEVDSAAGEIAVTCTPSGGTGTVHLALPRDWQSQSAEVLLQQIEHSR